MFMTSGGANREQEAHGRHQGDTLRSLVVILMVDTEDEA